jgi:DNA-binding response OmpR family regulator
MCNTAQFGHTSVGYSIHLRPSPQVNKKRLLLVDDNDDVRTVFEDGMRAYGFEVVAAASVNEALRLISTQKFDILLSDLHMPDAGDGFTVVSAMRHAHPNAVTLVLSGYPALQEAMAAILLEADEVLVKPVGLAAIAEIIHKKLANPSARMSMKKERVSAILERDAELTIRNWMSKVERNEELCSVSLSYQERTGHLPLLFNDLVRRLRLPPNAKLSNSTAAREHGVMRRKQGYTVAMTVEESRILQVSIFSTLQNNLRSVDFSSVLLDVMTIADEVDSQLKQSMLGFMEPPAPTSASSPA